ncbi:MAG: DUF5107 domain-containing protein, partial [Gemmatimonadota bacterium]|nr:DUF5107 domain-containing protein [Gemmatimonadota bacterium]
SPGKVKVYKGKIELPSYEFSSRELEPVLFNSSNIREKYPFPPFKRPYKKGGPRPAEYKAIFLENEYLKLTVVPDFGGRVYSLYDKVNRREVFYKNDVLKFSGVNSKGNWPVGNIELTGPYDEHMLTMYGEPLWFNRVLEHEDGSASIVMSNIDPYYRMKVNFIARLVPGLAAMEITVYCYNRWDTRKPYMFWVNAGFPQNEHTRFIYPMTRTIGHTTTEVAGWPYYSGVDYSWIKNNKHMLGVFGIDIYDDFLGAYDYGTDYGTFRYGDRRVVQGMKTWTWGYSEQADRIEYYYTDKAGPYIEIQSGRYTWDGHYEWLAPHASEGWSEWWLPVAGIQGLTTTTRDVALCLEVNTDPEGRKSSVRVGLSAAREIPGASVRLVAGERELLNTTAGLAPGRPFNRMVTNIKADSAGLTRMRLTVTDSRGRTLLDYTRPDANPGRKEYTPFTRPIDQTQKREDQMSAEELLINAETKFKEMQTGSALALLSLALEKDPGLARAHLMLGIHYYENGLTDSSLVHLEATVGRDPYVFEAYYYQALARMELADSISAERNLYHIPPGSAFYGSREYLLGRLAFHRSEPESAKDHLRRAVLAGGENISARNLLATINRLQGNEPEVLEIVAGVEQIDPTNRWAAFEKARVSGRGEDHSRLQGLLGGQSQEALELAGVYSRFGLWDDAIRVMRIVEQDNHDVYGTPPIFYYSMAGYLRAAGHPEQAADYCQRARSARGNVDRYPFRPASVRPLIEALVSDPSDEVAHFNLGCLLYHLGRHQKAISHWEKAVELVPGDFSLRRALGMAYAENGFGGRRAGEQLEKALELNPDHIRTFTDLSRIYSREGLFDRQTALLERALEKAPDDDYIIEGLLTVHLVRGDLERADSMINSHEFTQAHRSYRLRDKYRFMRYGMGARAFRRGDSEEALRQFRAALFPPRNLGADDFEYQSAPRVHYYIGLVNEKLGRRQQAGQAFDKAVIGWQFLAGDRDSFNHENFYMALALDKLGQHDNARNVVESMEHFARGQLGQKNRSYNADAHYLMALVMKKKGKYQEAQKYLEQAMNLEPDMLGPRFELRGDVPDALP